METAQYLRALGRSWFIVIIALVAGGAGGYYVYHHATPLYRSAVRLAVAGNGGDETTSRVLATQRAESIAQVANTPPAEQAAATAAGYPGITPGVSAVSSTDSPFINLTVEDTNPRRAQAIANSFAGVLPRVLVQVLGPTDTPVKVTNLAPASLPAAPFSPKRSKDVGLGLAAGLILGIFIALLREVFNRTVRDSDELERLSGLVVLGTVPRDLPKRLLPAVTDPRSARAEAYRQVRTTLLNVQPGGLRTIAVTSASLGEGKTSVATNVAAVFSRGGHRVALIDADLRRPRVAAFFGLSPQFGLTEVLSGVATLDQALNVLDDGRLGIVTSGRIPANPSEALGSLGMERVIEQLSEDYEYVIIDTPPVLPVTDASVLAPKVDGVVLVTRMEHTTRDRVKRALASLERVNASVLGVVPNQAGKGTDRDYRYPYRYVPSRRQREQSGEIGAITLHESAAASETSGTAEPTAASTATAPVTAAVAPPITPPVATYPQYDADAQFPPPTVYPQAAYPVQYQPPARSPQPPANSPLQSPVQSSQAPQRADYPQYRTARQQPINATGSEPERPRHRPAHGYGEE